MVGMTAKPSSCSTNHDHYHCHSSISFAKTKLPFIVNCMVLILCFETILVTTKAISRTTLPSTLNHWSRQQQHRHHRQTQSRFHFQNSLFTTRILRGGSQKPTKTMNNSTATNRQQQTPQPTSEDVTMDDIGGGAINEKERKYRIPDVATRYTTTKDVKDIIDSPTDVTTSRDDSRHDPSQSLSKFDPCHDKSHLYHALEGLERYPNYLRRWSTHDMDKLESALEQQLNKVRQQKQSVVEQRKGIQQIVQSMVHEIEEQNDTKFMQTLLLNPPRNWEELFELNVLDPITVQAILKSNQFKTRSKTKKQQSRNDKVSSLSPPTLEDILQGKVNFEIDPAQLEEIMDQEMFDVYSLPVFTKEFCSQLKQYVKQVVLHGERKEFAHLNLGRRIIDLDTVGLGWVNDLLLHLIMRPISRLLYKSSETLDELDWRQGYVAGYAATPEQQTGTTRHRLVAHTDDSEITLNVCIGDEFEGGMLQFRGLRGTEEGSHGQTLEGDFQPKLGTALIHAGRHLHEVTQVTSGERYAYIVWARSWNGSRSQTCPCCWLNRRQGNSCICGARWN